MNAEMLNIGTEDRPPLSLSLSLADVYLEVRKRREHTFYAIKRYHCVSETKNRKGNYK
jgi:hypothetical protein